MKKFLMLLVLLVFVTGCSYERINVNNYDTLLNKFLSNNTKLVNNHSKGYNYYLPSGVRIIDSKDFNETLSYNGYKYYLYIDIVSYYYKTDLEFDKKEAYYSKLLDYNDKKGYVEINEIDGLYRIIFYYNYAKIETYVEKEDIGQTLINICYVLNSLELNDAVINTYVDENKDIAKTETFDFYTAKNEDNFISYIEMYDDYEDVSDEGNIGNEEEG